LMSAAYFQFRSRNLQPVRVATGTNLSLLSGGQVLIDAPRQTRMLELQLGEQGLYQLWQRDKEIFRIWWEGLRSEVHQKMGLPCPSLRVIANPHGADSSYRATLDGMQLLRENISLLGVLVVYMQKGPLELAGVQVNSTYQHPLYGSELSVVADSDKNRTFFQSAGIRFESPLQIIALELVAVMLQNPEYVLGVTEVLNLETQVEKGFPGLLSQTVNRDFLTTARLAELLRMLIREGISVYDVRGIIETVADYCATTGTTLVAENDFDVHDIMQFLRNRKKGLLLDKVVSPRGTLKYIVIANESAERFVEVLNAQRAESSIVRELRQLLKPMQERGMPPVNVAVLSEYRIKLVAVLREARLPCSVFSFDELPVSSECIAVL